MIMKRTHSERAMQRSLHAKGGALLLRMQTPAAKKGMQQAFDAAPFQLGRAAVEAARKNG